MNIKLLTEHHLECLSLKGGCIGLPEPTLVKMPDCWKPHVVALLREIDCENMKSLSVLRVMCSPGVEICIRCEPSLSRQ